MAHHPVAGEVRERDLGDELGLDPGAPRTAARGGSTGASSRSSGVSSHQGLDALAPKPVPTLPA